MTARRPQGKTYDGSKHTNPTLPPRGSTDSALILQCAGLIAQIAGIACKQLLKTEARILALSGKADASTSRRPASKPSAASSGKGSVKSRSRKYRESR